MAIDVSLLKAKESGLLMARLSHQIIFAEHRAALDATNGWFGRSSLHLDLSASTFQFPMKVGGNVCRHQRDAR
jgi:hypothetical protein